MSTYQTVCKVSDVGKDNPRDFRVGDQWIGIFVVDGEYYAIDNQCPHAGAALTMGAVESGVVRCRIHHWGFCLKDGEYVDQDLPQFNARTFPVRVVDDEIQVDLG